MRSSGRSGGCLALFVLGCAGTNPHAAAGTGGTVGKTDASGAGATGGSAGNGSGGVVQKPPPHVVTACDKLKGVGVWENITPAMADLSEFGTAGVAVDPSHPSIVYVGTEKVGILKSTDCGATWVHINTGKNGGDIDNGRSSPVVDPIEPNVIYTRSLYGTNGFFKSTNGGVDWEQILTPEIVKYAPYGGFVGGFALDPGDHLHILVSWHQVCAAPYTSACYGETKDGGATWVMRNGDPSWNGGEGAFLQFLDSNAWLFSSSTNGMWRSTNHGDTWTQVPGAQISHGAGQLYRTPAGAYFLGSATGVLSSADGVSWAVLPGSGKLISGVIGDGTTLWASEAFPYNVDQRPAPFLPYHQASVADPMTWTQFDSPMLTSGASDLDYDPDHHILYSTNFWEGIWRVVVK